MTVSPDAATTRPDRFFRQQLDDMTRRIGAAERATTGSASSALAAQRASAATASDVTDLETRLAALEARVAALEGGTDA